MYILIGGCVPEIHDIHDVWPKLSHDGPTEEMSYRA